jgi:amino-acid N-acetyltransferase
MNDKVHVTLEPLPVDALDGLAATLREARLPHADLCADLGTTSKHFFCAFVGDMNVGYVGLEIAGPEALLRSAVIFMRARGHGYGRQMVERLLAIAAEQHIRRIWLLTESAPGFFAKLGFRDADRRSVPAAIAATEEFVSLCPPGAACMLHELPVVGADATAVEPHPAT